ncbi:hypothetical protein PM082_000024 [Marasmius tenuissimus]|nr:hypothetical protein PM082_000024 [Marasmius tenuissimus]
MVYLIAGVQHLLVDNAGTSFKATNQAYLTKFRIVMDMHSVLFPVAFVIGDSIVIWRACALSGRKKQIIFLLVVFQLAVTGAAFGWIGCFVAAGMPFKHSKCRPVLLAMYALSIATNIAATTVIGYATWSNWKAIQKYLKLSYRPVRAERIAVLLLESGLLYAFLLTLQFLIEVIPARHRHLKPNKYEIAKEIFWKISTPLVGIYPTALIILVFLERSLWDTNGAPSLHLNSAVNQVNLEHDNGQCFHQDSYAHHKEKE